MRQCIDVVNAVTGIYFVCSKCWPVIPVITGIDWHECFCYGETNPKAAVMKNRGWMG